jgi:hypothetical protein
MQIMHVEQGGSYSFSEAIGIVEILFEQTLNSESSRILESFGVDDSTESHCSLATMFSFVSFVERPAQTVNHSFSYGTTLSCTGISSKRGETWLWSMELIPAPAWPMATSIVALSFHRGTATLFVDNARESERGKVKKYHDTGTALLSDTVSQ